MSGTRDDKRRSFGNIRRLPSGRFQARYRIPGSNPSAWCNAPITFAYRDDAEDWLVVEQAKFIVGVFPEREQRQAPNLDSYQVEWMGRRELRPRTRHEYERLYEQHISPTFGAAPIDAISAAQVETWHNVTLKQRTGPTRRAHAYALLKSLLNTAITDGLITRNPCQIRGASRAKRARAIQPATLEELAVIETHMPSRLRLMVPLSAFCMLRFGEAVELRRKDVDTRKALLHIRRGVTSVAGKKVVGAPKTEAGIRDVPIPPHLIPDVRDHLKDHVDKDPEALLFPGVHGGHLSSATLYDAFYPAREAAGRPDLRWHDLRHSGAFMAAATNASLATIMARGGWSDYRTAMRYQHSADQTKLAADLSKLAEGR